MFKNLFLVALRNLQRDKFYTLLNILGLTIGIACSFLIFLYIQSELSYDRFYPGADNIYRLGCTNNMGGKIDSYCNAPRPVSPMFKQLYPEVQAVTRVCGINGLYTHSANLVHDRNIYNTDRIFAVDSTFFQVFQVEFLQGDANQALRPGASIVVTETLARSIFGSQSAFGKTLILDNRFPLTVTGVLRDLPGRTHFPYDALLPWNSVYRQGEENAWYGWHVYHYLRLAEGTDSQLLEAKFPAFYEERMAETFARLNGSSSLFLQPLTSIRLYSDLTWEMYPNGDIDNLYIFGIIGLFLLLIASINYTNLTTARSLRRSQEVGMRKIFGSHRTPLIWQFMSESVILSLAAAFLALWLVELLLPIFNSITSVDLTFSLIDNCQYLAGLFLLGLLLGILGGIYPALFLSRFTPVQTLKAYSRRGVKGALLRKILILLQFTISISLIICTIVVGKQVNYARHKELGYNRQNVLVIPVADTLIDRSIVRFQEELRKYPDIIATAASFNIPGTTFNRFPARLENSAGEIEQMSCQFMQIDYGFLETMQIPLITGRNYSRDREQQWFQSVLVNESLVRRLGWEEPLGKRVLAFTDSLNNPIYMNVIGVVRDFHSTSLRQEIYPILIYLIPDNGNIFYRENKRLYIRMQGQNLNSTIDFVRNLWQEFTPDNPMPYFFLDARLEALYQADDKLVKLIGYFTGLSILIACLGLFGLAAFTVEQRLREIGIRKVMGSTTFQLIFLLSLDFTRLIILANIFAWPLAFFSMRNWLQNFAYRTNMELWIFLMAAFIALLIAFLTVSFQTLKASRINPADVLKYE
ncbi:MAG: ABC transporter permease [Candidatus Cloacimonetes bacterium]|nr:ABC transporter permease [Candidatus Cloacimonadota bacterium]